MNADYARSVASWLAKANSDLATAKLLILGNEPHLDTGSYHCQQAAEKALKGWLTSQKVEFRKIHDLIELLVSCAAINPAFHSIRSAAQFLIPFATQFRYPGDLFEPPYDEAKTALEAADAIVHFVLSQLEFDQPTSEQT